MIISGLDYSHSGRIVGSDHESSSWHSILKQTGDQCKTRRKKS